MARHEGVVPLLGKILREGERNAHLPLLIGAALILSGWFASFTAVGAQFIYGGSALVLVGIALRRTKWFVILGALILFVGWGGPLFLIDAL
jgi:hypothetical protein